MNSACLQRLIGRRFVFEILAVHLHALFHNKPAVKIINYSFIFYVFRFCLKT
jgi:hypothetical protein